MKKIILVILTLLFCEFSFSQNNKINPFIGVWEFVPPKEGYDSFWIIFKDNKSIDITFWLESKKASIYNEPYSYYGFWDASPYDTRPKHLKDLKTKGKYVLFYDDLIENDKSDNKIGYDKFGNLYKPTRSCDWSINDELPEGLPPTTINFNFGKDPDVYKKIDKIPDYVLLALKENKKHWQKYLSFMEHGERKITLLKSFICSEPNKPTQMYLLKGDEVEILETKGDWLKIRYYDKKVVEGWIKKSDVE